MGFSRGLVLYLLFDAFPTSRNVGVFGPIFDSRLREFMDLFVIPDSGDINNFTTSAW